MKLNAENKRHEGRKGFSLVELLIAVVVLGILSAMVLAAGTAAQNKARTSVAQNDLDGVKNAIYQALMTHSEVMKFKDDNPSNSIAQIIEYVNYELDDAWKFKQLDGATTSGGVAYSNVQKDPWGSPYGMYIYTNTYGTIYPADTTGALCTSSDSVLYIIVCSAGRNGTGGPMGIDGTNFTETKQIAAATAMVNNSDGIDDLGVIIRVKNGNIMTASFGTDQSSLGTLSNVQWIFGKPGASGGILYDFSGKAKKDAGSVAAAGSIDKYYDSISAKTIVTAGGAGVAGSWTGSYTPPAGP